MRRSGGLAAALAVALAAGASAGHAEPAAAPIDLPGARAFTESISIAPDGTAYVSSASGGVLRVALATGAVTQWIRPGGFGTGSTFGVLVDGVNNVLWVCSNDLTAQGITIPGADGGSTLKAFDLKTGEGRLSFRLAGEAPLCNDMAVAKDGTLYVTETSASHILRLKPGASALEDWHADPALAAPGGFGLDGIAFGGDGQLYVNNVRTNQLLRVEINPDGSPGRTTVLESAQTLSSPDGLRPLGGQRFLQAEGGGRIALVTVDGDTASVETLGEGYSSPTGVDVHGDTAWFVQGEFGYIFNPQMRGKQPPPFKLTPLPLPAAGHALQP